VSVPAVANTWGSDFAHVHYFSERGDPRLGIVQVVNDPSKTRASAEEMATLKFLADTYPDSPWYYKADDDAYLHVPHLADLASRYDPGKDWYIGTQLLYDRGGGSVQKYCSGGVGYLISNSLMKRIASTLSSAIESCCSDVQVGTLVQRALRAADGADVCTSPPSGSHVFTPAAAWCGPPASTPRSTRPCCTTWCWTRPDATCCSLPSASTTSPPSNSTSSGRCTGTLTSRAGRGTSGGTMWCAGHEGGQAGAGGSVCAMRARCFRRAEPRVVFM